MEATIALLPIETAYLTVDRERLPSLDAALDRMRDSDDCYRYSVAWVDWLGHGRGFGRGVLMRANHSERSALPAPLRARALAVREGPALAWPPLAPGGLLRPPAVAAFNELYYRRPAAAPP